MVEKGAEYEKGDPRRYYKFRVVFQGNQVKDQNWDIALFNEMQSQPATLEASRIADIFAFHDADSKSGTWNKRTYKLSLKGRQFTFNFHGNCGQKRCIRCGAQYFDLKKHYMDISTLECTGNNSVKNKWNKQVSTS